MPESETEPAALSSSQPSQSEEVSVVVLPDQETPAAPTPPAPEPPAGSATAPLPPPQADSTPLLPTDVIPEPIPQTPERPASDAAQPRPEAPSEPANDELPVDDGQSTPPFTPSTNEGPLLSYGDRFPHAVGSVGGCFGLSECRQVTGAGSYRAVARSLIAGLEDQGYAVRLRDDLEDTGRNVYELTPPTGGASNQFLMVFSGDDGSAIYVMSPEVMTLDDLKSLATQAIRDRQSV